MLLKDNPLCDDSVEDVFGFHVILYDGSNSNNLTQNNTSNIDDQDKNNSQSTEQTSTPINDDIILHFSGISFALTEEKVMESITDYFIKQHPMEKQIQSDSQEKQISNSQITTEINNDDDDDDNVDDEELENMRKSIMLSVEKNKVNSVVSLYYKPINNIILIFIYFLYVTLP